MSNIFFKKGTCINYLKWGRGAKQSKTGHMLSSEDSNMNYTETIPLYAKTFVCDFIMSV